MQRTVLVVDDERSIVDILKFNLSNAGYNAICAYDGREALDIARSANPDLILLDIMLPHIDGFEVCKTLRGEGSNIPIIMITAREEETDKVFGLELGADDYITKPFSIRELMARVNANMRRVISTGAPPSEVSDNVMRFGDMLFDFQRLAVFKSGKELDLTQREYELLKFLASHPGKVSSRQELMSEVWKYDYYGDLRAVDVAIRRLREKLEDNPAEPSYVITKRGVGYYFNDNV